MESLQKLELLTHGENRMSLFTYGDVCLKLLPCGYYCSYPGSEHKSADWVLTPDATMVPIWG